MYTQNIYTVEDNERCPDEEGEPVIRFVEGVFSRVAQKVISVGEPVDWLIIKSNDLNSVTWASQNFFEGKLEKALMSRVRGGQKVSIIHTHSIGCGGAISTRDIEKWIKERLEKDFEINYLNNTDLNNHFIGYHLNMRG